MSKNRNRADSVTLHFYHYHGEEFPDPSWEWDISFYPEKGIRSYRSPTEASLDRIQNLINDHVRDGGYFNQSLDSDYVYIYAAFDREVA